MSETADSDETADSPTLALARELVRRPSVTPNDAGCQPLIADRLAAAGFTIEHMRFGEVDNLWARRGTAEPVFAFAGHTDVVPTGNERHWSQPPFDAAVVNGVLYGRGAADMKGSVAAMVTACERLAYADTSANVPNLQGSLAILLTSDEEGPAVDGTKRVMETLTARGERIDYCLLGEPSSTRVLGDVMRLGRRGSLGARLLIHGRQGHVAYPDLADNPVHRAAAFMAELVAIEWDAGDEHFPPTTLQISNLAAGTGATNVIPGEFTIDLNLRYGPAIPADTIQARIRSLIKAHKLVVDIDWNDSARPFLTGTGILVDTVRETVKDIAGQQVEGNTAGGTSDGRFIAPSGVQLVEFGPINASIHAIDEHVDAEDLDSLSSIYETVARRLLTQQDT